MEVKVYAGREGHKEPEKRDTFAFLQQFFLFSYTRLPTHFSLMAQIWNMYTCGVSSHQSGEYWHRILSIIMFMGDSVAG